jgi:aerobic-type carbon monoxide dehydrogenase small subunit (CoxS/CutS family)
MATLELSVNGAAVKVDVAAETPLLWVLRDVLELTGTKYGCGVGMCGACTVHLDDEPARSCLIPIHAAAGRRVVTIEGLSPAGDHPLQRAWIAEEVPQCGYCQSGQIMTAVALLRRRPQPSDAEIDDAMTNLCRCGTYQRIRKAIHRAGRGSV